jgi:hypothetical protein
MASGLALVPPFSRYKSTPALSQPERRRNNLTANSSSKPVAGCDLFRRKSSPEGLRQIRCRRRNAVEAWIEPCDVKYPDEVLGAMSSTNPSTSDSKLKKVLLNFSTRLLRHARNAEKTKIVYYCKDVNRRGDFPNIHFDFLGFLFRVRQVMWVKPDRRIVSHNFQPAASPEVVDAHQSQIRRWELHHRSDKSLAELAEMYNSCIHGWINDYSHFYRTQ